MFSFAWKEVSVHRGVNQIVFDSTASSIVFGGEFDGLSVVMGADTLPVLPDEHANHSSLIVFASPLRKGV